jgi:hypothetical protein
MQVRRFTPAFLIALAATAGVAQAAVHNAESPAVARAVAQSHQIETALQQGRLTSTQAAALQSARNAQESQARALASHHDVAASLALSHQQDRLDWAIRSGNTSFVNTTLVPLR